MDLLAVINPEIAASDSYPRSVQNLAVREWVQIRCHFASLLLLSGKP